MRQILLSLPIMVVLLGSAVTAFASETENESNAVISDSARTLTTLKEKALTEGISVGEIEEYLYSALAMVYNGKCDLNGEHHLQKTIETNTDLSKLAELGYIPFWPDNPITWEPMKVLGPGDKFSAGDLYLAVCSGVYLTTIGNKSFPHSFDLFVFGPQEALSSFGEY